MALTDLSRCSAASRQRADPLAGSAPLASRWLLIEHPGPWAKEPTQTPPMLGAVGERIEQTCASFGGRVLLIRRPGRAGSVEGERSWFAIDTVRRTWVHGLWRTTDDLQRAATSLGVELSNSDLDAEPMVLVCTHGTRDPCCAVRGRPIATSMARTRPDEIWECTHLGGHRFSGTLLSLPDGACYGQLDTDTAAAVVTAHREGRVSASHLRGTTRWLPPVQAALAEVLAVHGPAAIDDAVPGSVETEGGDAPQGDAGQGSAGQGDVTEAPLSVTVVEVFGRGPLPDRTVVRVVARALPDAALSCGAGAKPHTAYRAEIVSR